MTAVINEAIKDTYLQNYIGYHAHKVAQKFPNSMDHEDVKQELWEAIIKAMNKYDGSKTPSDTARSAVFSKYGHMIDGRMKKLPFNEKLIHYDQIQTQQFTNQNQHTQYEIPSYDSSYELVEANDTLDKIDNSLKVEANKAKQYSIALNWFRLMRKGYNTIDSAHELSVSVDYLYVIQNRIFKGVVRYLPFV
jgi:hypothetical protein